MSQSAPWQAQNFPNPQGANVQFYDPTKLQTSNASSAANSTEQVPNGQNIQAGASNSWNSWGNWGDNQGYQGTMQGQGQVDLTQQQQAVTNQNVGDAVQSQPHGQGTGDQQYYNQWNQGGWDPNNAQHGWDPNAHQNWNQQGQQSGEQGQQPQAYWDGHQWQWHTVDQSQSATVQQQHQHHQDHQQEYQDHQQQHQDSSLSNRNTSGQFYDQISPDTSGNYSQSSASFQSHSAGLNDSTSSSFDQSSSSQPSASSQESPQAAEDSMNSESGTVAGFFGKDDGDFVVDNSAESKLKSVPQFLNVDPGFQRTDSAISNASLQTMNLSSQGSVASLEELDMKSLSFQNQMQGVQQSEQTLSQPQLRSPANVNLNQNSDTSMPSVPQTREEDDHHSGNLNDWEIVPDQSAQTQTGVNFYIGGNQEQAVDNPQISVSQAKPVPVSGPPPPAGVATPPVGAPAAGLAGPPGQLLEGSPRPPSANSPAGANPFRKSPRNVRRNLSNQSLPSLHGDNTGAGSPVIFSPEKPSNSEVQTASSVDSIPRPAPSSIANSDSSAFKPPVPKEPSDSARKPESVTEPKPFAVLPDKMQPKPLDKDATPEKTKQELTEKSPDSKPPVGPGSRSAPMSPRKHTSAFHPVGHRAKHSMSPATTLWDNVDAPATNIILAPAAPVLSATTTAAESGAKSPLPVIPIQASLETKLKDKNDKTSKGRESEKPKDGRRKDSKGGSDRDDSRRKEDDNRSINSLDELDAQIDYRDNDDYRDGRYRDKYGYRDYRDTRDPRYDYDRPSSRADSYRDYGRRRDQYRPRDPREPYSHGQYYDERYERPRSRQDEDRPSSRSGREADPGKSQDYDRDGYYRERDRYRSSYYDYYRDPRYYDDPRYSSYYGRDQRYSQAYYDEYYRQQGYSTRYSDYYGSQYGAGGTEAEYDRYSHHSLSRGHTPALDDNLSSADYREHPHTNGSRSSSRQDYDEARDYARHGYSYDYGYDNYAYEYGADPNYGYYDNYYGHDDRREAPGRLTPQKHTIPHVRACFGANGQLIKVLPNRPADGQPATVEVHSLEEMMADNREAEELKFYPGPLSKVDTHKNDVLQFCQKKAQSCSENINMVDRDSAELIWRLLELLIKQNGSVVGTDIADLLLEGHQPTSLEYSMMGMKITQSTEELDKVDDDGSAGVKVTSDRSQVNKGRSLEEVTDRFRNLLLYGRKKDALEWATKNNLWGHALFLASKMDTRTHANVMIRFANSAMKMNDPLQTLYQLMSGRQPAAVTCVVDERWGDWRPHLAMILSNSSSKPELDRKSIAALGDTMASKGCLHASHFCYIMAQSSFGTYTKKTSKIVLIGSSHTSAWEDFATNEAIQCTEIYEYAQSLGNNGLVLPHFQVYKFLYATRLAEYGFLQEALHYCEVIANNVQQSPSWFQPAFVKVLYELSNRLKYHDPQRLHAAEEAEDPMWLQQLQRVSQGYDDGSIQPVSGNATPAMFGTSASSESGEVGYTGQGQGDYQYGQDQTYSQYNQDQTYQQYGQDSSYQYGQDQSYQTGQYGQYGQTQAQTGQVQTVADQSEQVDNQQTTEQQNQWQYNNYNYGYQQTGQTEHQPTGDVPDAGQQTESQPATQIYGQQGYNQQYGGGYTQDYMGSDRLASQRSSIVSAHSVDTEGSQDTRQDGFGGAGGAATFDYFEAATAQGKIVPPASRYRTTSGSSSTGSANRQRTLSESSTGSVKMAPSMKKSHTDSGVGKKDNSPKKQQQKKSGWFGGWFSSNKKKEMHLPKDDKQSIVWDPVEKRWKNTDGDDEDDGKPAMPPPKDADLGGGGPPGMAPGAPSMGGPPAGNRFSLQKGRGARNQYVDVLSTKTTPAASVPSNLFNVLPPTSTTTAAPSVGIFNPSGNVAESSSQPTVPSGGQTSNQLEPPTGDPDATSSAITNPIMFDPTQFQPQQTQPAPSKGPKFGQRRQYPK